MQSSMNPWSRKHGPILPQATSVIVIWWNPILRSRNHSCATASIFVLRPGCWTLVSTSKGTTKPFRHATQFLFDLNKAGQKASAGVPPFGDQVRLCYRGRIKTWKGSNCATTTTLPWTLAIKRFCACTGFSID